MNPKRPTPRHIIIKIPKVKDKERILKAAREKQLFTYKRAPIKLSADFSKETLQARKDWQKIFKVMKSKDLQLRLLYPAKLSFRIEGQIKSFPDKQKLKEFIITKPLLCEMLKGLQKKKKSKTMKIKMAIKSQLSTIEYKKQTMALAGVAQWVECWPVNQTVAGSIPVRAHCLGCWPGPQ